MRMALKGKTAASGHEQGATANGAAGAADRDAAERADLVTVPAEMVSGWRMAPQQQSTQWSRRFMLQSMCA